MTEELITPEGVLVYDGPPHTDAWYACRRAGITGTDLPRILGVSKYGNSLSVWQDKRGEVADSPGEAAFWGLTFEEPIAQVWCTLNSTNARPVGIIANNTRRWIRASLDRLVDTCPLDGRAGVCGLEIKTRSAFKSGLFKVDVPDDILAQCEWGLIASGLDHIHVAVLIGGQELVQYIVHREEPLIEYLTDAAQPVWDAVLSGDPPQPPPDADNILLAQLNVMFENREGMAVLPPEAEEWLRDYHAAMVAEGVAKRAKALAKSALVQMLGSADTGIIDDTVVCTYKRPDPRDEVSSSSLRALHDNDPETYKDLHARDVIVTVEPGPVFSLKWKPEETE